MATMAVSRPNKRMILFFFPVKANDAWTVQCRSLVDFVSPDENK